MIFRGLGLIVPEGPEPDGLPLYFLNVGLFVQLTLKSWGPFFYR